GSVIDDRVWGRPLLAEPPEAQRMVAGDAEQFRLRRVLHVADLPAVLGREAVLQLPTGHVPQANVLLIGGDAGLAVGGERGRNDPRLVLALELADGLGRLRAVQVPDAGDTVIGPGE